jgi:simple sugar transport system ATP-binding protein
MVQQHFSLIPAFTAVENFALGGRGIFDREKDTQRFQRYAAQLGLTVSTDARPSTLSPAEQQQLEITKALGRECRILILDEPAAALPPVQAAALLKWVRSYAHQGRSVVLVTHKLRDAIAIADDVTVMRHGRTVLSTPIASVTEEQLLSAMLGEESNASALPHDTGASVVKAPTGPVASLSAVSALDPAKRERVEDVTLALAPGEIVGVAGVERSGHRLLLRIVAGRIQPNQGTARITDSIGFIPEDRHREAIALDLDIRDNVALREAGKRRGWVHWRTWATYAQKLIKDFDVHAPHERVSIAALSGGNQQKVVLARELAALPQLIVAENPTHGLDVRAASEIRQRLRAAAQSGTAVLWYSSDLDELAAEADRVLVLYDGHVRQCAPSRDDIGRAMLGTS